LDLWGALKGRMAVRSELEWTDKDGQQFKSYGVQIFQFSEDGLVEMNCLNFNDKLLSSSK
jgi:nuclear transport factor 2 (NTF2) superfamily protein